jgi:post-segregation antitoxin (ccd killing protein)
MAIRPADLQLAYLAAPQNAAEVSAARQAATNAQAAAQATFAAQVQEREEMVKGAEHAEKTGLRTNPDGHNGRQHTPNGRRHTPGHEAELEREAGYELRGDGEHTIDFTA